MGKERIFSIFPFLNAMSAETIKAPPTDLSVYPFYNTYYVTYIQDTLSYVFSSGSSVTSVITNKNVKRVV